MVRLFIQEPAFLREIYQHLFIFIQDLIVHKQHKRYKGSGKEWSEDVAQNALYGKRNSGKLPTPTI